MDLLTIHMQWERFLTGLSAACCYFNAVNTNKLPLKLPGHYILN